MHITEVRVILVDEERLKAYVNVTFENCFVVRGLRVINGSTGYFVSMPSRRRKDGTYQDLVHPITEQMRAYIEEVVLGAYEAELGSSPVAGVTSETTEEGAELVGQADSPAGAGGRLRQ